MPYPTRVYLGAASALVAVTSVYLYESSQSLVRRYPIQTVAPSYLALPSLLEKTSPSHPEWSLVTTRIPLPKTHIHPNQYHNLFLKSFYSTWTLQLESAMTRLTGYKSVPDQGLGSFLNGLFVIEKQNQNSTIVWYRIPSPVLSFYTFLGKPMIAGGRQELAVSLVHGSNGEEIELAYASAEHYGGDQDRVQGSRNRLSSRGMAFHQMYMRFLLDQAKRKMERELQKGGEHLL